ncbi:hypothetical protein CsSME_00029174 [Camellia sinensis var. sinensis]
MLYGNLPECWADSEEIPKLWVMKFSSNKLSWIIQSSIGHLSGLGWLHLNNNSLYRELPLGLRNCTTLVVLDLGGNGLSRNIPGWIGELECLRILRLHKNMFNGKIPIQLCQLSLQIIDLANNNLERTIPSCFGNLTSMILNESPILDFEQWPYENMIQIMKGNELEYCTTLSYLVNMDLSRNNLTGTIPAELSLLSGRIPTGNQLQTLDDPSIYVGNSELCGVFVPKKCSGDRHSQPPPTSTSREETYEGDESENVWFYLVIMSGYATGLWGVIGVLLFKKN